MDLGASLVDNELDVQLAAQLKGLTLVLQPGEADSFLRNLLGDSERRLTIPLGIEWTRRNGVRFVGSEAFETFLPMNLSIGPITVEGLALQLFAPTDHSADLTLTVGAQISGKLGPISFAVEGMGFRLQTTFAPGNVGPFDLDLGFKPPTGLGLVIAAPGVTGGGYLGFDPQRAEYSGMLQLELADRIALKAIGLLTTRLPDGRKGYSLLILITVEGFTPIPLGLGFTLTGIGGLLGLHRTVSTSTLREGLKTGTLNSILFPVDPLRNAPQLLSDLRRVFPPTAGRHVFGPMVQLRWGTPTLLTLELALLLELPAPVRLIVLGPVASAVAQPGPSARADPHGCPGSAGCFGRDRLAGCHALRFAHPAIYPDRRHGAPGRLGESAPVCAGHRRLPPALCRPAGPTRAQTPRP